MFNEVRTTRDMKYKDKMADKFQTEARFENILAVDLEDNYTSHPRHVSLGEFLRRNSEEYWIRYIGLRGDVSRGEYRRYGQDICCEDLTESNLEVHRSFYSDISTILKKRRSSVSLSTMTKIARRKVKAIRRKSSVLIQFYSKLRKREDSSGTVVQHAGNGNAQQTNCAANHQHGCVQHGAVVQQTELTVITASSQQPAEPPPFLWVYSTSNHSLDAQVHNSQDLLVRPDSCEVMDGECKNGLRKNLRGKWNRLVKKKPHHEIYTIPAELRPQLKQIYVY